MADSQASLETPLLDLGDVEEAQKEEGTQVKTRVFLFLMTMSLLAMAHPINGSNGVFIGKLEPSQGSKFQVMLKGAEPTQVTVDGSGGNVDCYAYDNQSKLISSDEQAASSCRMKFVPAITGPVVIMIVNHGDVGANVTMTVQ